MVVAKAACCPRSCKKMTRTSTSRLLVPCRLEVSAGDRLLWLVGFDAGQ
jgi:hypothetical protein